MELANYKNRALHFSGGKDSLACLYLLRDHLADITVYWCDTQDTCPETRAVVDAVRPWIPRFEVVPADVVTWRRQHGYPSDIVTANTHPVGTLYGVADFVVTNRYDCCVANYVLPIHQRMLADGVDLVIRGTKLADTGKVPAEGPGPHYDVWLPLRDWSHADVFGYLARVGAPENPIYDYFKAWSAPTCLGCTAWWSDGKAAYLKARHPEQYLRYRDFLQLVAGAVTPHLADLYAELR